ncbi:MAG: hypothetical protein FWC54_01330 [Actinomycetia bacterium]|nr:hypothetical protein [Actinomycetes bacterium]
MMALMVFVPGLKKTSDPLKRLPFLMAGIFLAFLLGGGMLFLYHSLAPHSFLWFGLMVIASFFTAVVIKTVPQIMKSKRRV